MYKKILACTAVFAFIFVSAADLRTPPPEWASITANAAEVSYYDYEELGDGIIEITLYRGGDTEVEIPAEIDGKQVVRIGKSAFFFRESIKSVTIPEGVTSIGEQAFCGCTALKKVTIPDSVTSIGGYAFNGCSSLKKITIPDSMTDIGDSAFDSCALKSVTIPDSVTSIGDSAFGFNTSVGYGITIQQISDFTIYCNSDTAGEEYAIRYGFKYKPIPVKNSKPDSSSESQPENAPESEPKAEPESLPVSEPSDSSSTAENSEENDKESGFNIAAAGIIAATAAAAAIIFLAVRKRSR